MAKKVKTKENLSEQIADLGEYKIDVKESVKVRNIMKGVSKKVKKVLNHPRVKEGIYGVLDKVDENYMETTRSIWNKLPDDVKWTVVNVGSVQHQFPTIKLLNSLVRAGLLDYDEKQVQRIPDIQKFTITWTARIGPLIEPALAVLKPLVKPITAIIDLEEEAFEGMRNHLKKKRVGKSSQKTPRKKAA